MGGVTIPWGAFSDKHRDYIRAARGARMCVVEGAIRSGKTIDHCIIAAAYLEHAPDRFHLASGSTVANAKLNIGVCNGFGLESLFRGRCKWGKYRDNDALFIDARAGERIVIFAGGGRADSYRHILGNSYGLWIATEINEHYDCPDSRTSFVKVASGRQIAAARPFTLWDLNPCGPKAPIYEDYIDRYRREVRRRLIAETIANERTSLFAKHQMDLARERGVDLRREVGFLDVLRARMTGGRIHGFIKGSPLLKRIARAFFRQPKASAE